MNKKVKIILLSTVMTPPTIIPLLAASCTNEDPESEIKQIKVSVTTLDKFAKDVTDSDIKITGYRPSVFKISQTHQPNNSDSTTLEVLVVLTNITKGTKAQKFFTIKGFKADSTDEIKGILAKELEKISGVSVENHANKIANTITSSDIKVAETTFIDKNTFEYYINPKVDFNDKTKLNVSVRLKHKQSGILSKAKTFEITGFKTLSVEEEQQIKNLEIASKNITVDVEGKENKFAKDVLEADLKFTIPKIDGLIDDPSKYEIVEKSWSVTKSVPKNLEVYFQLKNKDTKLISSKRKVEIKGFKQSEASTPEEKALQEALNAITLSYEEGPEVLKKTDAGDLVITKVKLENQKEGFEYSHKFKNDNPSKVNYNDGFRTVVITIKKGSKSLSKEINLECFKSDYDVIIKQREKIKNIDLYQTIETKNLVESLLTGQKTEIDIFYDFKEKKFYDKKYDDPNKKQILDLSKISFEFGTTFGRSKLIKVSDNKYKAAITLAKSYKVDNKWKYIYDTKQTETNELSFEIIDQNAINKVAEEAKTKFDYPDKKDIFVNAAEQSNVILPNVKLQNIAVKFIITKFEKDSEHSKLVLTYQAEIEYKGTKFTSKSTKTEITGFKADELGKEFNGLTVDYDNKDQVEADKAEDSKFKLLKGSETYNAPSGITKKIEVLEKDKYNGKVKVKVILTKDGNNASKEFTVEGFKKVNFDFNSITADSLTIEYEGITKTEVLPTSITKLNVNITVKPEYKDAIEVQDFELTDANNTAGSLKIKITIKNLVDNLHPTRIIEKDESGFKTSTGSTKEYKLKELYDLSVSKNLFKVDTSKEDNIIKSFNKVTNNGTKIAYLAIKDNVILEKNKGNKIDGLSISDALISGKVNTHGTKDQNICKHENKGNAKGVSLIRENNKWIIKWRLLIKDNKPNDEIFEQIIFEK
ncbi:lipoprotein 17-related variable surface protein [Metamycoplasma hyosynoviae]|uniref:lipoprotein 17-related variable surface protein n=1 Tax=Metamycoplasma hyosynoviae TaxID=29559 RepID=UPI00249A850F|nr:lipoprotein 17-related variable surface protein [Metamycoplasma hyosynoviae]MDI3102738.1 lipoprotein 17-related variable surface protein [Metamycoplasma hyosynoviae]